MVITLLVGAGNTRAHSESSQDNCNELLWELFQECIINEYEIEFCYFIRCVLEAGCSGLDVTECFVDPNADPFLEY